MVKPGVLPVPQAKYELLTNPRKSGWKTKLCYAVLILTSCGVAFAARAWLVVLVLLTASCINPEDSKALQEAGDQLTQDAQITTWLRRAKMYAESTKENENADRNTTVRYSQASQSTNASRQILVCYYTMSNCLNASGLGTQDPDALPCTHLLLGFASVVNCTVRLTRVQSDLCQEAAKLKNRIPGVKVMLSIGGGNQEDNGFSEMVRTHATRKKFIRSILNITKELSLDGVDLDWEFPAWLGVEDKERIRFAQLLQEIKTEFRRSKRELLLSVAVAAPQAIVDQSYIVPQIALYADFVNLLSYDYHFYVWYYPVTGLNAPLFPRSTETGYLSTLNVNFSAQYWLSKGLPREKLVIGIPAYGHSYKLDNARNHGLSAPANGVGIGSMGFVDYATVEQLLEDGAVRVFDYEAKVPYCYKGEQWISYDDTVSVARKAAWIKENGFGGAMLFSLNVDVGRNESFPLTKTIGTILYGEDDSNSNSNNNTPEANLP